eukprot:m51a1_g7963 hypothetical protein (885) ;mRNA; r:231656-240597
MLGFGGMGALGPIVVATLRAGRMALHADGTVVPDAAPGAVSAVLDPSGAVRVQWRPSSAPAAAPPALDELFWAGEGAWRPIPDRRSYVLVRGARPAAFFWSQEPDPAAEATASSAFASALSLAAPRPAPAPAAGGLTLAALQSALEAAAAGAARDVELNEVLRAGDVLGALALCGPEAERGLREAAGGDDVGEVLRCSSFRAAVATLDAVLTQGQGASVARDLGVPQRLPPGPPVETLLRALCAAHPQRQQQQREGPEGQQAAPKQYLAKKRGRSHFDVSDYILLDKDRNHKLDINVRGPFRVIEKLDHHCYTIENLLQAVAPLLGPRDLCCLSRTCTRLRTLCRAPQLWADVTVRCSRQALLLTRATFLRGALVRLTGVNVDDVSLCCAVTAAGPSLRSLTLRDCPSLTSAALCHLGLLCPQLQAIELEGFVCNDPLLQDAGIAEGCAALARACGPALKSARVWRCDSSVGTRLLEGLLASQQRGCPLPLASFACDALSLAELLVLFEAAGLQGALANLAELVAEVRRPESAGHDTSGVVLEAIARACPALTSLRLGHAATTAGVAALAECCPLLRRVDITRACGVLEVPAFLRPPLESLAIAGPLSDRRQLCAGLARCAPTLTELSMVESIGMDTSVASAIVALPRLRVLRVLRQYHIPYADALEELSRCAPLRELALSCVALTGDLVSGTACSALVSLDLHNVTVGDSVLAALPAATLRELSVKSGSGCSAQGIAALLGNAAGLRSLRLLKKPLGIGGDVLLGAVVPCMERMAGLSVLHLGLQGASDAGAVLLRVVCGRLEELRVEIPLMTSVGASVVLKSATRATTVGLGKCAAVRAKTLRAVGPCVHTLLLDPQFKHLVLSERFNAKRPCTAIVYGEFF